jgi:hypothetical protein
MTDYRRHLDLANRHIAQAKELIAQQLEILAAQKRDGHDTKEGEKLLEALLDSLAAFETHQRLMLTELVKEANPAGAPRASGN